MQLSTPEERARQAQTLQQEGWKAVKIRLHHPTVQEDLRTIEQVRQAVGESMTIMVDANQAQSSAGWQPGVRWDFRRAVETARVLQQLHCAWLEETAAALCLPGTRGATAARRTTSGGWRK
jgi:L-alanine-DL-glutamate epimerase-like enolase superfamily enzyme